MSILLYAAANEPITRIALKYAEQLDIFPIHLQEVLKNSLIFDKITKDHVLIHWSFPCGKVVVNDTSTLLLNRVAQVPISYFQEFSAEDQSYARAEFFAYLTFAISSFPNLAEKPDRYSLMAPIYPLTTQWKKVEQLSRTIHRPSGCVCLKVPKFFLGNNPPTAFLRKNIVSSGLYNFYWWRAGTPDLAESSLFLFERPKGSPFLVLVLGQDSHIYPLEDSNVDDLTESVSVYIRHIAQSINRSFGYFVSEMLVFVDQEKITFGMITNCPMAAQYLDGFEDLVVKFLAKCTDDIKVSNSIH